jgi:3-methyladenine DNA glycosylase Tag
VVSFADIRSAALARIGKAALAERLPTPKDARALRATSDDRYLSMMSLRVFRAGLKHDLVDSKWPAFEEVFLGFEPRRLRMMSDEDLEALLGDRRIIRHWGKIRSVRANAIAMNDLAKETGNSFGSWLAGWPTGRTVELWHDIARRFSQMGGNSGPYFLRMAGKDTFILTPSVVHALLQWRVIDNEPKGKSGQRTVQSVFNSWHEESGEPLCRISMTLAASVD